MSDDAPKRHGYHTTPGEGRGFGDGGSIIQIVGPKYDRPQDQLLEAYCPTCAHEVDAICPTCKSNVECNGHESNTSEIETLKHGLLVALEDGHSDGTRLRVVALCRFSGFFKSDTEAAQAVGVNPSTVHRAVKRLSKKIKSALCKRATPEKPNN